MAFIEADVARSFAFELRYPVFFSSLGYITSRVDETNQNKLKINAKTTAKTK